MVRGAMFGIILVGLLGNIIVLTTILALKEYKKSKTNWYVMQLAAADTLFLAMLPFTAQSEIIGKWIYSLHLCKFKEAVLFINYYASTYFLVIMSFDRYIAVTQSMKSNSVFKCFKSPKSTCIIIILGWFLSILLSIPLMQFSGINSCQQCVYTFPISEASNTTSLKSTKIFEKPNNYFEPNLYNTNQEFDDVNLIPSDDVNLIPSDDVNLIPSDDLFLIEEVEEVDLTNSTKDLHRPSFFEIDGYEDVIFASGVGSHASTTPLRRPQCRLPESKFLAIWIYCNFIGAFIIPFLFISFCYGMIIKTAIEIRAASRIGNSSNQKSYQTRVTIIVLSLVTLFFVSWFPWYLEKVIRLNGMPLSPSSCRNFINSMRILAYLNSALNPYFYNFLGSNFRQNLKQLSSNIGLTSFLLSIGTSCQSSSLKEKQTNKTQIQHPDTTPENIDLASV